MSDGRAEGEAPPSSDTLSATGGPPVIDVTPSPETRTSETEKPRAASGRTPMLLLAIVVAAVASSPYWAPPIASVLPWGPASGDAEAAAKAKALEARTAALDSRVAELSQAQARMAALEQRLTQAEQRLASAGPSAQDGGPSAEQLAQQTRALSSLADRVAALDQRVAALPAANANPAAAQAIQSLQSEVRSLSQNLAEQAQLVARLQAAEVAAPRRDDAALLIAIGQLRAVLATSRGFGGELRAAEALAHDRPDLAAALGQLDGRAERGVPTLAVLAERFRSVIGDVVRAAPASADGDWSDQAIGWLKRLLHVRRIAERPAGGSADTDGLLADAEAALKAGDLPNAVAALRRLPGPAAEAAKPWLDDAAARLDADQAVAGLDAALTRGFLAAPEGSKP